MSVPPPPLRVVFFGTPDIAIPTLETLIAGPHQVVGVVSQPDRRRGRGKKLSPSPISEVALREDIPLLRPEKVGEAETVEALRALEPDLGVVLAFGQFLPKKVRELPSCGYLINAHASLLPKYRGASPIAHAILNGEEETGISVMRIEREMDAGPVALVRTTPIEARENTAELSDRLALIAADAIGEAVDQIARKEIAWTDQDASKACEAPKFEKFDAWLDFRETATRLADRIHALAPKPGASVRLIDGDREEALKILRADVRPGTQGGQGEHDSRDGSGGQGTAHLAPGALVPGDTPLEIATSDGTLVPLLIQRAGSKAMPVADFLRGFPISGDARFEATPKESESR